MATILPPLLITGLFLGGTIALQKNMLWEQEFQFTCGVLCVAALGMFAVLVQSAASIQSYRDQMEWWEMLSCAFQTYQCWLTPSCESDVCTSVGVLEPLQTR